MKKSEITSTETCTQHQHISKNAFAAVSLGQL